ncbi:MAG: TetR family transcriptional regulator [Rhizobiales bacterium]|nr:TetR family transcriptional regulator [Hyphomicrobiales bacterium]
MNNVGVVSHVEDEDLVERRRAQIVSAATLLFSRNGFYKTTVKEIAKTAGMSSGLVYLYVREKEDILLLTLLDVLDAYAVEIPKAIKGLEHPMDRLVRAIDAYCRVVDSHAEATVLAYRSTKSLSPERRKIIQQREIDTNRIIADIINDCMKKGLIKKMNVDILTYQMILIAHGWALKGWYFKSRLNLDEYILGSIENVLGGVLTQEGRHRYAAAILVEE